MLLLEDVRPPPIVVPATVRPGLAGKVKVQDTLLKARAGGDQVTGLRMAVSEHFLILTNYKKELYKSELEGKKRSAYYIDSKLQRMRGKLFRNCRLLFQPDCHSRSE